MFVATLPHAPGQGVCSPHTASASSTVSWRAPVLLSAAVCGKCPRATSGCVFVARACVHTGTQITKGASIPREKTRSHAYTPTHTHAYKYARTHQHTFTLMYLLSVYVYILSVCVCITCMCIYRLYTCITCMCMHVSPLCTTCMYLLYVPPVCTSCMYGAQHGVRYLLSPYR